MNFEKIIAEFRDEIYGKEDALFDRKGNNVSRQVENALRQSLTTAVKEREEELVEKIKRLGTEACPAEGRPTCGIPPYGDGYSAALEDVLEIINNHKDNEK